MRGGLGEFCKGREKEEGGGGKGCMWKKGITHACSIHDESYTSVLLSIIFSLSLSLSTDDYVEIELPQRSASAQGAAKLAVSKH